MPLILTFKKSCKKNAPSDTSIEAAAKLSKKLGRLQQLVFDVIEDAKHHGVTSDEIAIELGWLVYEVRPRASELRGADRIVDSGRRRKSAAGNSSTVWVLPKYKSSKVGGDDD
jgi:transcription initiation factor IIE alpha subunit